MQKLKSIEVIKNHLVGKPLTWFGFCAAVYLIFSLSVALYSFVKTKEEIKHDADHRLMMAAKAIQLVLRPHFIDRGTYDSYLE